MIARSNGASIYYETYGVGIPLILVEGIGYSLWMWEKQKALSKKLKLIMFDNRGVGKSSKDEEPYTMEQFCSDIDSVADASGVDSFYLLGSSMGGMIAQEYALRYPERLLGLILSQTNTGLGSIPPDEEVLRILSTPSDPGDPESLKKRMLPAFSPSFPYEEPGIIDSLIRIRTSGNESRVMYMQQLSAVLGFKSSGRLSNVSIPALIITGDKDRIVPPGNSGIIHEEIQNSRLVYMKDAGHLAMIENPEKYNNEIIRFIDDVQSGHFEREEKPEVV